MALTPDQQATLQLLLERGQSYSDLATVLGIEEAEVRARARAALTELGGSDPDRNVAITDYLLGQADPIGRADASRHLRADPADHELAALVIERLGDMYPDAELPRLPGQPRPPRARRRRPEREGAGGAFPGAGLSPAQLRVIVISGCAAVLLLAVVLGVTGAFGGGGDDDSGAAATTTTAAAADEQLSRVALKPADGGDASGEAVFGLATGDQPYVELAIRGLDPAPEDRTYVVWLILEDKQGYPLSPITLSREGTFSDRFPIPSAVLPVVARVQSVEVSIAPVTTIRKLVRNAIQNTSLILTDPGETVLSGEIPKGSTESAPGGASQGG